jgi:hypothetical protein
MASYAVSFTGVNRGVPVTTENIFTRSHGFQMIWVYTATHSTQMVELMPGGNSAANGLVRPDMDAAGVAVSVPFPI